MTETFQARPVEQLKRSDLNTALVFAGGVGRRMSSDGIPKQFLELSGKPIIIHTLEHFERHAEIDLIIVVCVEPWIAELHALLQRYGLKKVAAVVPGGETGQLSIYAGLDELENHVGDGDHIVLIHDAVRPLINADLISRNISSVRTLGSTVTTAKVKETIFLAGEDDTVETVVDRSRSLIARAPQTFKLTEILAAHRAAMALGNTDMIDSCSIMRAAGHTVHLIDGPSENIKITTPDDYFIAQALEVELRSRAAFG